MERLTPSDLENATLRYVFRGYEPREVHSLLHLAAQEIATLKFEIRDLKVENAQLGPLRRKAETLAELVVALQRASTPAETTLERTERELQRRVEALRAEIEGLSKEKQLLLGQPEPASNPTMAVIHASDENAAEAIRD